MLKYITSSKLKEEKSKGVLNPFHCNIWIFSLISHIIKVGLTVNPLGLEEVISFEYEPIEVNTTDIVI